jgi:hypothetical protein
MPFSGIRVVEISEWTAAMSRQVIRLEEPRLGTWSCWLRHGEARERSMTATVSRRSQTTSQASGHRRSAPLGLRSIQSAQHSVTTQHLRRSAPESFPWPRRPLVPFARPGRRRLTAMAEWQARLQVITGADAPGPVPDGSVPASLASGTVDGICRASGRGTRDCLDQWGFVEEEGRSAPHLPPAAEPPNVKGLNSRCAGTRSRSRNTPKRSRSEQACSNPIKMERWNAEASSS